MYFSSETATGFALINRDGSNEDVFRVLRTRPALWFTRLSPLRFHVRPARKGPLRGVDLLVLGGVDAPRL